MAGLDQPAAGKSAASVSPAELRRALGQLPTGVTVVTSLRPDGEPVGTTVSAVCSVSAEPALLLVCLARSSETLKAVREHRQFAVNVLTDGQHLLSNNFARGGADATWEDVEHDPLQTGLPRLTGTLASFDCVVHDLFDGGDHEIVIGRVRHVHIEDDGEPPLLHWQGRYVRLVGA